MNARALEALTSALYVSKRALLGEAVRTDDERIRASGLYAEWAAGSHALGEIRNAGGQVWECFQAHDNAVYPGVAPGNASWGTFWRPLHGTSRETARAWVAPGGAHDLYRAGETMLWKDGRAYRCLAETNFSPEEYPAAWEAME